MPVTTPAVARKRRATTSKAAAADSRQAILETAARLFREEGYAATSLRSIAAACGMQAGSLYYHFESKDQIVGEVLNIGVQRVFDAVVAAVEALPETATLADTLRCAIGTHLGALLQAHDFTSANIRIFGQVPADVRATHRALRRRYESYWVQLLQRQKDAGHIGSGNDLQRTVFFLFGAMNWATEWYDRKRSPVDVVAEELTALVVHGLQGGSSAAASKKKASGKP